VQPALLRCAKGTPRRAPFHFRSFSSCIEGSCCGQTPAWALWRPFRCCVSRAAGSTLSCLVVRGFPGVSGGEARPALGRRRPGQGSMVGTLLALQISGLKSAACQGQAGRLLRASLSFLCPSSARGTVCRFTSALPVVDRDPSGLPSSARLTFSCVLRPIAGP
jgi:hypothetical protein